MQIETIQNNRLLTLKAKQQDIQFDINQQKERNATMIDNDKVFQQATRKKKTYLENEHRN